MQDNAEAFVRSDHCGETHEPHWSCEESPPAACSRECEEYGDDEAESDVGDSHGADEEDTRFVAVTDGPADEVGVRLPAESGFGDGNGGFEG